METLKNGLNRLKDQHKERREYLLAELKAKRTISESDQDWLDGAANLVDEERLVETMENAIDYGSGIAGLSPKEQEIVEELTKLGGGKGDERGKKRKRK